jgi:hypothetical protein
MTPIYTPWNENFGDQWATLSLMLNMARAAAYNNALPRPRLSRFQNGKDLGPLHDEILASFHHEERFISVPESGNTPLSGYNVWQYRTIYTQRQWCEHRPHAHVVYHFEGLSTPELKNPPEADQAAILATIAALGLPAYRLGKHLGLRKCIELAATAAFAVVVDSGPSHLIHSVGTPMFLLQYELPVVTCHRGKPYTLCEGAEDFRIKLGRYVDYRAFIGAGL